METRKITIVSTKTQKRHVVETNATTLAELKLALRSYGIDYEGMTFYEGLTKTELKTDDSLLPHDVMRRGVVTNELAFMLSPSQKKIKSGMDRKEAYSYIKEHNLGNECLKKLGKNFTMCKTDDLVKLVENYKKGTVCTNKPVEACVKEEAPVTKVETKPETKAESSSDTKTKVELMLDRIISAISYLTEKLADDSVISWKDKTNVDSILEGEAIKVASSDSPYSKSELDEMFSGLV